MTYAIGVPIICTWHGLCALCLQPTRPGDNIQIIDSCWAHTDCVTREVR